MRDELGEIGRSGSRAGLSARGRMDFEVTEKTLKDS